MTIIIPLTQGQVALIDDDDAPLIMRYRWQYQARGYAVGRVNGQQVYMHRFLLNAPPGLQVDHINGNRLDNSRANLRLVTPRQNRQNSLPRPHHLKGISWEKQRWRVRIHVDGQCLNLGSYSDPHHAALLYDAAARHFFGDYARTNFPPEAVPPFIHTMLHRLLHPIRIEKRPSPYRGVSWHRGRWRVRLKIQGREYHLGCFRDEIQAARAYDAHARRLLGRHAVLNFP